MKRVIVLAGVLAIGTALVLLVRPWGHWDADRNAPLISTTPQGITFQKVRQKPGGPLVPIFADDRGHTLYHFDDDRRPGELVCTDECAATWTPYSASNDAKPNGPWSIVIRRDGARQWAYDGKPLYRYAKDEKPGEAKGEAIDKRWHITPHKPATGLEMPDGIFVQERTNAGGQTLVDAQHNTLYVFDGDVADERTKCPERTDCQNHWHPLLAPELANRVGDFSAVARADGITQWSFRGRLLYISDLDTELGDANARAGDPRYHVALIERYFIPKQVMIFHDSRGYDILATIGGKTLYTRSQYNLGTTQGLIKHSVQRGPPELGKELSIDACDAGCLAKWTPLQVPEGAKAAGFWSVLSRGDGTQQWAYEGYALYTYAGDSNPGDEEGRNIFDLDTVMPPRLPDPLFVRGANALYWHNVEVFSGN